MGTLIALSADAPLEAIAMTALEAAWQTILQVEALMHPTRDGSDLALLHATPVGIAIPVHAWTREILQLSQVLHRDSAGVFDPCLPDAAGRFEDLELHANGYVRRRVDLRLDLGGIAKGYAVDRAVAALRLGGCTTGLVNAGGDLRVFGARAELVQLGRGGGDCLRLEEAALAVSQPSTDAPSEHQGYYSRVAGYSLIAASAAVVAETAAVADALAKCALFLPPPQRATLFQRWSAQLLPAP
jgi:thiamine biosynthesis lipoprotein